MSDISVGKRSRKVTMVESALDIVTAEELVRFDLGTVVINRRTYTVLTGYEGTERKCFWCGESLTGSKLKRYCRGHMKLYYNHFDWGYAKDWCIERYEHRCANCGMAEEDIPQVGTYYFRSGMEVHHIIPVNGESRQFTAYNLPWNLIPFCHKCHLLVQAAMREEVVKKIKAAADPFELAITQGQAVMGICKQASGGKVEVPSL